MTKLAKSKARKIREHRVRQGKTNPADYRGSWNGILPFIRMTPTLQKKKEKERTKHKSDLQKDCS